MSNHLLVIMLTNTSLPPSLLRSDMTLFLELRSQLFKGTARVTAGHEMRRLSWLHIAACSKMPVRERRQRCTCRVRRTAESPLRRMTSCCCCCCVEARGLLQTGALFALANPFSKFCMVAWVSDIELPAAACLLTPCTLRQCTL